MYKLARSSGVVLDLEPGLRKVTHPHRYKSNAFNNILILLSSSLVKSPRSPVELTMLPVCVCLDQCIVIEWFYAV